MVRLEGERVVLRPLREDELDAVLEARDRLQVGAWTGGARARARLHRRLRHSGQMVRGHLDLAIEVGGRLIGEVQARTHPAQTLPPGVYELGIVIFDGAHRGKGHGVEAVALLTGWLLCEVSQAPPGRAQAAQEPPLRAGTPARPHGPRSNPSGARNLLAVHREVHPYGRIARIGPNGTRVCKACNAAAQRAFRERQRAGWEPWRQSPIMIVMSTCRHSPVSSL